MPGPPRALPGVHKKTTLLKGGSFILDSTAGF